MYDEKCLSRVGRNVRALRIAAGLGQEELDRKLGVSQTHMCNLECSRVKTSLAGLLKLANVFDCSLDVLLDKKAALKLAAERMEASADDADETTALEITADAEQESADSVYSWEAVRQLLELLHKAQAGVPAVKPATQNTKPQADPNLSQTQLIKIKEQTDE